MKRGDFVIVSMQGDFGKPRPALIVQADQFDAHATVTILPVSSTLVAAPLFRIEIAASAENGLQKTSQIMVDKAMTIKRDKLDKVIGSASAETLLEVSRCMAVFLGIAK